MRINTEYSYRENIKYLHFTFCLPNNPELAPFSLCLLADLSKRSLILPILQHVHGHKPTLAYGNEAHH